MALSSSSTAELALQNAGENSTSTSDELLNTTFTSGNFGNATARHVQSGSFDIGEGMGSFIVIGHGIVMQGNFSGFRVANNGSLLDTDPATGTFTASTASSNISGYTSQIDKRWDDNIPALSLFTTAQKNDNPGPIGWDFDSTSNSTAVGSGLTNFQDAGNNTRTIRDLMWAQNTYSTRDTATSGGYNYSVLDDGNILIFGLSGTSVPNSDTTFVSIVVNGLTLTRTSAEYISSENGNTVWLWTLDDSDFNTLGTTGSKTFVIKKTGTTVTVNNGIAEEFGGADSADVTLSHYYRGAPEGFVIDNSSLNNVPSDGTNVEIKFSDFRGLSNVDPHDNVKVISPGYKIRNYGTPRGGTATGFHMGYNAVVYQTLETGTDDGSLRITASQNGSVDSAGTFGTPTDGVMGTGTLHYCTHFVPLAGFFTNDTNSKVVLGVVAGSDSNAGFTTLSLQKSGSSTTFQFNRSDATYTYYSGSGGVREWAWTGTDANSVSTLINAGFNTVESAIFDSEDEHPAAGENNEVSGTSTTTTTLTIT